MAPKVTLHYFNLRARGELIRWILSYSGQEWVDHRIEFAEWPAIKATTPFGQLPYIEIEGKEPLAQTYAIARYLSRQHGLAGTNAWEEGQVDALADYAADAAKGFSTYVQAFMAKDEKKAQAAREEYTGTTVKPFLSTFEKTLQHNKSGSDYLVGTKPSWADFVVVQLLDEAQRLKSDLLDPFPLLKAHQDRVHNLKGIKEFLAKRPETPL
ncbi:hypothetical protein RvY_10057 [Ramazzottius varieornatus]|uniref:glutathione transferase n=1 Tax=Ramazzottius varieornatus TaxID=947166 RepID=A0A1D1VBI5_RAMVA|nr:hypothetical protein RvY_10057 [Ramazzottius varieornatus]